MYKNAFYLDDELEESAYSFKHEGFRTFFFQQQEGFTVLHYFHSSSYIIFFSSRTPPTLHYVGSLTYFFLN